MSEKSGYHTKQKEELHDFLMTVPGKHVTAADICEHFKSRGRNIGTATVYRQLEKLVDEGLVNKYIVENSSACFEYINRKEDCYEGTCFHCKCEKCGKLIHLHCEDIQELQHHVLLEHGFRIDPLRTVFYGICEECREAE